MNINNSPEHIVPEGPSRASPALPSTVHDELGGVDVKDAIAGDANQATSPLTMKSVKPVDLNNLETASTLIQTKIKDFSVNVKENYNSLSNALYINKNIINIKEGEIERNVISISEIEAEIKPINDEIMKIKDSIKISVKVKNDPLTDNLLKIIESKQGEILSQTNKISDLKKNNFFLNNEVEALKHEMGGLEKKMSAFKENATEEFIEHAAELNEVVDALINREGGVLPADLHPLYKSTISLSETLESIPDLESQQRFELTEKITGLLIKFPEEATKPPPSIGSKMMTSTSDALSMGKAVISEGAGNLLQGASNVVGWMSSYWGQPSVPDVAPAKVKPAYIPPGIAPYNEAKSNRAANAIIRLTSEFNEKDYLNEGIFRTVGDTATYKDLAKKLTDDPSFDISQLGNAITFEEKTSALKQLLKDMKLFQSDDLREEFFAVNSKVVNGDEPLSKEDIQELKSLVSKLTQEQQEALKQTIKVLIKVIANSEENKMTSKNILIATGPSLIDLSKDTPAGMNPNDAMALMQEQGEKSNLFIKNLIENYDEIFPDRQ